MPPKSKYSSSATGVGVPTLMPRTKTQKVSLTDPDTKKTRLAVRSTTERGICNYFSPQRGRSTLRHTQLWQSTHWRRDDANVRPGSPWRYHRRGATISA